MTQPQLEPDGLRVSSLAQKVLSYFADEALAQLVSLPAKQYATTGPPVYDCEQVVVSVQSLMSGAPGAPAGNIPAAMECGPIWSVVLELGIVRCAPKPVGKGVIPKAKLDAQLIESSKDVGLILGVVDRLRIDAMTNVSASIQTHGFEGGLTAVTSRITVALP